MLKKLTPVLFFYNYKYGVQYLEYRDPQNWIRQKLVIQKYVVQLTRHYHCHPS